MKNWLDIEIKTLGRVVTGKTPPTADRSYFDGPYHFVSPKDLDFDSSFIKSTLTTVTEKSIEKFRNQILPQNSVMFTSLSYGFGKMGITNSISLTNQQINSIIVDDNKHDFRFVYYLLRHYKDKIFAYNAGIVTPIVPKSVFEKIQVRVPESKTLQRRIASILSAYDDLIENNLKRIKLLEESTEITYKQFKKETIENWDKGKFSDFFKINNGCAFKAEWYAENGVPIIRTKDYSYSKFLNIAQPIFIDEFQAGNFSKFLLKEFDFMLIMVGASIGRYGIILPKDLPALQNQNQWALRESVEYNHLKVIKLLLIEEVLETLLQQRTGAARDFFRASFLNELNIQVPTGKLDYETNTTLENFFNQINVLQRQNTKLREARDILLPRLMNGEIEV